MKQWNKIYQIADDNSKLNSSTKFSLEKKKKNKYYKIVK